MQHDSEALGRFWSETSSITNTKVFIKLDGEFWPWKGET